MRTLILIKPDAMSKRITGPILNRLETLGLKMTAARVAPVTEELIKEHYANLAGKPFLPKVINFMLGKENNINPPHVYAFVFEGENAVEKVRGAIGATNPAEALPYTIRGQFGVEKNGIMHNCVHASGDEKDAEREIALWFKEEEILKIQ